MKYICILFILLILFSCNRSEKQAIRKITIDPVLSDSAGLSNIASGVEKILLETNDSCLITRVNEIEMSGPYIFINDAGKRILQFDTSGKFIKQIGRQGRGPGEYLNINNIALDSANHLLYAGFFRKIMVFEFSGKYINEIDQKSFSEYIDVIDNKLWTVSTINGISTENNKFINLTQLIRYSLQGESIDTIKVKKVILENVIGTIYPQAYYISDIGTLQFLYFPVLIKEPILRDTLYQVKENNLAPFIKLDFGNEGVPKNGKKPVVINNIFRTKRFLFAEYNYNRDPKLFCLDLEDKSFRYNLKQGFTDDVYGTGIIRLRPLDLKNGIMYYVKDAFEVKSKIKGLTENSNPVIFVVKIKRE